MSRTVTTEFHGYAAHQVYCSSEQFIQVSLDLLYQELWVYIYREHLSVGDLLIIRNSEARGLLGVFQICSTAHDIGRGSVWGLKLFPLWSSSFSPEALEHETENTNKVED